MKTIVCTLYNSIGDSYGDAVMNLEEKKLQEKYLKILKTNIMVKTNAIIQFMVKNPENNKTYVYEKEIDFIPSVGLDIQKPISNKIHRVRHDGERYIAQIEAVLEPTEMSNFDYYAKNGFTEIKIFNS